MLNGHDDDDPMASGALSPVAPLSNSDDSDNTMQVDSDVDVGRNVDADADGEYDDDDAQSVHEASGPSSSYHNKRVVRVPLVCCGEVRRVDEVGGMAGER